MKDRDIKRVEKERKHLNRWIKKLKIKARWKG